MTTAIDSLPHASRRALLQKAAVLAAMGLGAIPAEAFAGARTAAPQVLTAWNQGDKSWAGLWTPGALPLGVALPARAHQLLILPQSAQRKGLQALVLARRPGEYLLRMDPIENTALQWHSMEDDRYLSGHAVLSTDGQRFFTTETDAATGEGLIAERDVHSLEKLREFASGGIGPHALLLEPGGTLLVANGGILNLPETGRRKLNIGTMAPNLTRLDTALGAVVAQFRLPDPLLSLRHLAIAPDGTIAVGLQAEHPDPTIRRGAPAMALLDTQGFVTVPWQYAAPLPLWNGYGADVCWSEGQFWISAPKAGWLAGWSPDGKIQTTVALPGAGALASTSTQWLAAGERTAVLLGRAGAASAHFSLVVPWDNHATLVEGRHTARIGPCRQNSA
ncbi:MAG: DUF1513 domain-containing protein [Candidatus Saccharibacteria bacterium]|nr:DUF1513 domain-containing protein [Rhodoferax sp.]